MLRGPLVLFSQLLRQGTQMPSWGRGRGKPPGAADAHLPALAGLASLAFPHPRILRRGVPPVNMPGAGAAALGVQTPPSLPSRSRRQRPLGARPPRRPARGWGLAARRSRSRLAGVPRLLCPAMAALRLAALFWAALFWASPGPLDASSACPPCAPARCPPLPARGCPLGEVRDACGCCLQCGRGEGEACGGGWGGCAAGLECRRRRKGLAGACVCKGRYPVCGSDGLTYPSACQLRAASLRAQSRGQPPVQQRSKGPCEQGPSIVTPPKDVWNVTGAQIFLSCEVIGVPTPVLTWNKVVKGQRTELLPGDRENLAIQTRGGPEKHEVTGWVLISPLSKDDSGEYECHALNSQGEATASARITVVNSLQEIPTVKGGDAEL